MDGDEMRLNEFAYSSFPSASKMFLKSEMTVHSFENMNQMFAYRPYIGLMQPFGICEPYKPPDY